MSTIFQKYAAALLPFFVLVIGGSQTVFGGGKPFDWSTFVPYLILVLGAIVTYIVKLLPGGWQGAAKTGIAIITTILSAILPFLLPGGWNPDYSWQIILVGVLTAVATEFGVQIRTTPVNDAGVSPDPASDRLPEGGPEHLAVQA